MKLYEITSSDSVSFNANNHEQIMFQTFRVIHQLGKFSVNGEWLCGGLFAVSAKSGPTGAEHVARSQLDRYVLFLIQSVIIKCEIQCSYKRVITLLNCVYLTASYITYIHGHCDRACVRAYATANTAHSIPNDNHSDLRKNENSQLSPQAITLYFSWKIFSVTKIRLTKL